MSDLARRALAIVLAIAALPFSHTAFSHEVRPAYLQIVETAPGQFDVLWKQPAIGEFALDLVPTLSNGLLNSPPDDEYLSGSHILRMWKHRRIAPSSFDRATLNVRGLQRSLANVFVELRLASGQQIQASLTSAKPQLTLDLTGSGMPARSYLRLGVDHILTGIDHLSFVLGLVLLVRQRWRLLRTITSFTLAHSITLGASALGYVQPNGPAVEALVGISIMLVAVEIIRFHQGNEGIATRRPEILAFTFGLLHGFAFAGSLADVGLPREDVLKALLLFNCGVELGQVVFIGIAWVLLAILRRYHLSDHGSRVMAYGIGTLASYWTLERIDLLLQPQV